MTVKILVILLVLYWLVQIYVKKLFVKILVMAPE